MQNELFGPVGEKIILKYSLRELKGHAVVVKALCYKLEDRGFETR
jgi:hypothetical protein